MIEGLAFNKCLRMIPFTYPEKNNQVDSDNINLGESNMIKGKVINNL